MTLKGTIKVLLAITLVVGLSGFAFGDTYSLSNSNGGDGYVVGSYPSFQLYGSDNGVGSNYTTYTTTVSTTGAETFTWAYTTYDCCGSYWDPAGYVLNGTYVQLSTDCTTGGTCDTSGTTTVALTAGDTFGWYVYSIDSIEGRGEIAINPSTTPEPSSLLLLGAGLSGLVGVIRRKR